MFNVEIAGSIVNIGTLSKLKVMKYLYHIFVRGTFLKFNVFPNINLPRYYWSEVDIAKCFSILGVPVDSDQETVRRAFLDLVKKFHPDSGCTEANVDKFQEIESAYRNLQQKFARDRGGTEGLGEYGLYYEEKETEEDGEFDIEHTAPQHRQYLSYGGIGSGTPFQREKQFANYRAAKAVNNVNTYRLNKIQDSSQQAIIKRDTKKRAKDIKTGLGMDRLVEDLIQESMARGDFDNLSGSGKPLNMTKTHENPYVDFVTHKMNQVMIDNGFTPTWILYQKEIRERTDKLISTLNKERSKLGPVPLVKEDTVIWKKIKNSLLDEVHYLNDKINTYNLMVPILRKQLLQFDLERESEKILEKGTFMEPSKRVEIKLKKKDETLLDYLVGSLFR